MCTINSRFKYMDKIIAISSFAVYLQLPIDVAPPQILTATQQASAKQ